MAKVFEFSKFQAAIFDWIKNGIGNAIISAVAGSGKTFTIVEAIKYINGNVLFLAFGKAIATELKTKVPANVNASTLHSFGYSVLQNTYGRLNVVADWKKYGPILDNLGLMEQKAWKWEEKKANREKREQVLKLIALVKNNMLDINDDTAIASTAEHLSITYDATALPIMRQVMLKAMSITNIICYDDMIYMPVVRNLSIPKYDWVLIDETQDLNRAQIELVLRTVSITGRVIAVGDHYQSIFGFRGADNEAMDRVKTSLKATELPLSVCYRCPKSHVELARTIVPHIEAAPNAIEGIIEYVTDKKFEPETLRNAQSTMILCRTNAPLTSYALRLLSNGIPCSIKGQDIGKGLISLVNKLDGFSVSDILNSLNRWEDKETAKLMKIENVAESQIEAIHDKADCIRAIADDCNTKQCIVSKIEKLFSDDNAIGVQLSSVHKAKGLEAETVYIIRPELLPLKRKNQKAWEAEQEKNIQYVAYTRSKNKLVFVNTSK